MAMAVTLGATTTKQHVQRQTDNRYGCHRHASHVEVDHFRHPIMYLPDAADDDAHDGEKLIVREQKTQYAWNDDE